jgi:hypothetical protein
MPPDLELERDDHLDYGSAQELRYLVNSIIGRPAITTSSTTAQVSHALLDALRLAHSRRHEARKLETMVDRLKETVSILTETEHGHH